MKNIKFTQQTFFNNELIKTNLLTGNIALKKFTHEFLYMSTSSIYKISKIKNQSLNNDYKFTYNSCRKIEAYDTINNYKYIITLEYTN